MIQKKNEKILLKNGGSLRKFVAKEKIILQIVFLGTILIF